MAANSKERHVDEYLIQLKISTNPHLEEKDARAFAEQLQAMKRRRDGPDASVIDRKGLDKLKERLKKDSKAIKVK